MKRALTAIALVAPALLMLFFRLQPQADLVVSAPLFHFYVVTFTTFSAAVISILLTVALENVAQPRHVLAAAAFAVMGGTFFSHGFVTPQAIIDHVHPAIQWSAWLTLFGGGVMFALASLDGRAGPPAWLPAQRVVYAAVAVVLVYSGIAAFAPGLLAGINALAAPWHRLTIFVLTLGLWLLAAYRLWQTWRATRSRVDGSLAFVALWLGQASISMHQFPLNQLSWWLYHAVLLFSFLFTAGVLVAQYERVRQFRVVRYYLATSLIATALLALVASALFAEFSYRTLVAELEASSARLVSTLARNVSASLPAGLSTAAARQEFIRRIAGEPMDGMRVYSETGEVLYPAGLTGPTGDARWRAYFDQALAGETAVRVREPGDVPEGYEPSGPVHLIETYTAIRRNGANDPALGILVSVQEAPELSGVMLRARTTGLVIAALTMGLLFAALMLVVFRADRIITARANELRHAYTSLRQAESSRDDLTHMIVHDLRTPLSVMTSSLDLLTRTTGEQQGESRERFVRTARTAGRRMIGLIDDLLNVAQFEAGELRPRLARTPAPELFADSLSDFTLQAEAGNRSFRVDCPPELAVEVDPAQISRVLANLVGNAFKYTEQGGAICVSARVDGDTARQRLWVSVRDNGEGIPDEYKTRIFDKFVQVPSAEGRPIRKGTGLGLTFCRLVIEAHGGQIWVEDAEGGGSEFKFWVPTSQT